MEKLVIDNKWFYLIGENEFEGKLTILRKEAFVFIDDFEEVEDLDSFVKEKIDWINGNKKEIIDSFMLENNYYVDEANEEIEKRKSKAEPKITYKDFVDTLFINNSNINLLDSGFMIDLDAEPDYLFGHLASMEIDKKFNIEFVGLSG